MQLCGPEARIGPLRTAGLGLVVIAIMLFFGCGRMPPEPIWEPDAADSTAIDSVVRANTALLQVGFNEPGLQYLEWAVPDSVTRKAIKDNPFKQRYQCDSMQQLFFTDSFQLEFSFIATLDTLHDSVLHGNEWVDTTWIETTATVTVVETIPGKLLLHANKYTRFLCDTPFVVSPGETLWLKYYDSTWTDTSMMVEKPLSGTATGGCVLRKETGRWRLWRLAGGQRFYAPTPDDAPYLAAVYLTNGVRVDTVSLRPDTLHFGIQRLYREDELPTFPVGDSVWVTSILTTVVDASNFVHYRGQRYRLALANKIKLDQPGVYRLYVEQIPYEVLYDAGGQLTAVVWGIPIKVTGGVK